MESRQRRVTGDNQKLKINIHCKWHIDKSIKKEKINAPRQMNGNEAMFKDHYYYSTQKNCCQGKKIRFTIYSFL